MGYYVKAHTAEIEEKDLYAWQWTGYYGISALVFAVEHCLAGQKAKTEYVKLPLVEGSVKKQVEEQNIENQRKQFVEMLQNMKANFEATHPEKKHKGATVS